MSRRAQRNEEMSYLGNNSKNATDKPSSRVKSSKNNVARERWNILRQVGNWLNFDNLFRISDIFRQYYIKIVKLDQKRQLDVSIHLA